MRRASKFAAAAAALGATTLLALPAVLPPSLNPLNPLGQLLATAQAQDPAPTGGAAQPDVPGVTSAGSWRDRRELTPQETEKVWKEYMPGLGSPNPSRRAYYLRQLANIGLPAVRHLITATNVYTLLPELKKVQQLPSLRTYLRDDIEDWYTRHATEFKDLTKINALLAKFRDAVTNDQIFDAFMAFEKHLSSVGDTVPKPQALNVLRAQAALTIGEIGDRTAGPEVVALLADDSIKVQVGAIEAMGTMRPPLRFVADLYPFLQNGNVMVRTKTCTALREMDGREAVDKLIEDYGKVGEGEENAVRRQYIFEALKSITQRPIADVPAAWGRWWSQVRTTENPLQIKNPRPNEQPWSKAEGQ